MSYQGPYNRNEGEYNGPPAYSAQPQPVGMPYPPVSGPSMPPPYGYPQPQPGVMSPQPTPVINQPTATPGGWANSHPSGGPSCPPGLEYLTMIDQLLVHQKVELLEAFTGFETANKYTVKNSLGQKVYFAVEDSDCCTRNCCGKTRPFEMKIFDNHQHEVIHIHRPLACDSCCYPCCLQNMEISSPPGTVIGYVKQEWSIFYPNFKIQDARGDTVLRIEGPLFQCSCSCGDVNFKVKSADGTKNVGKITKQWTGLAKEAFTDADYFGITFPMDLDVKIKAVMLGACFLIDFMYFERSGEENNRF